MRMARRDCSDAIESELWTFIKTDDSDLKHVLTQAPELAGGVDLVYVDSLHSPGHVARLAELYFPFVRQGDFWPSTTSIRGLS